MLLSREAREGFPELSFQLTWEGEGEEGRGAKERTVGKKALHFRISGTRGVTAQAVKDHIHLGGVWKGQSVAK